MDDAFYIWDKPSSVSKQSPFETTGIAQVDFWLGPIGTPTATLNMGQWRSYYCSQDSTGYNQNAPGGFLYFGPGLPLDGITTDVPVTNVLQISYRSDPTRVGTTGLRFILNLQFRTTQEESVILSTEGISFTSILGDTEGTMAAKPQATGSLWDVYGIGFTNCACFTIFGILEPNGTIDGQQDWQCAISGAIDAFGTNVDAHWQMTAQIAIYDEAAISNIAYNGLVPWP